MSGLSQAVRNIRNIWGHGDDDYAHDEEDTDVADLPASTGGASYASGGSSYSSPSSARHHTPSYGGGGGGSHGASQPARGLRAVPSPLRSREKNIYTIKPKSQEDACIAADYLKTGDAVIVNLNEVDRAHAVRIIDFMSGVCYGLDSRGHAMKLGDAIFLYTPAEFEIRSDEVDYGENQDPYFKDLQAVAAPAAAPTPVPVAASVAPGGVSISGYTNPGNPIPTVQSIPPGQSSYAVARRAWER
jgi:cell division inhibitor SepF